VRGADKLWALKSSLEIPLAHIVEIRADPASAWLVARAAAGRKYWTYWPVFALGKMLIALGLMRNQTGAFEVSLR
jgi:hypothetical protein